MVRAFSRLLPMAEPDSSPESVASVRVATASSDQQEATVDFETVYRQHFAFVWRSVRAMGVVEASIDDCVQDVFVVVHRQLPGFEGRAKLSSWLFAIAYHVASNYRRRERRKGGLSPLDSEPMAPGPDPEVALRQAEAWAFVGRFLDTLDEDKRVVFVATELEGLRAPEVACALGIPVNTVYTRIHHARQAFRKALEAGQRGGDP
jgi:RNA polymerase sigma-70 factor (ECF subfamily)